jgi:Domain of unknown function (DUF4365)
VGLALAASSTGDQDRIVLDARNLQGKVGEDYVRVLASAAGLLVYTPDKDYDGVDFLLRWPGRVGPAASPAIDVQVKSWSRPQKSGGTWRFDGLTEVQFNKLAGRDFVVPRYLFLVVVPDDPGQYSEITADGMLLRYQGFYISLREQALFSEPSSARRRTVHVPIGNILTVRTLQTLMLPVRTLRNS